MKQRPFYTVCPSIRYYCCHLVTATVSDSLSMLTQCALQMSVLLFFSYASASSSFFLLLLLITQCVRKVATEGSQILYCLEKIPGLFQDFPGPPKRLLQDALYTASVLLKLLYATSSTANTLDLAHCTQRCNTHKHYIYTVSQKKLPTFKLSVTLSNLNRFSKILHRWKAYEICYKTHMTLLTLSLIHI